MDDRTKVILMYVSVGLRVLSARVLMVATLLLAFTLFAWAMMTPDYFHIGNACAFALLVWMPVTRMDRARAADRKAISPKGDE